MNPFTNILTDSQLTHNSILFYMFCNLLIGVFVCSLRVCFIGFLFFFCVCVVSSSVAANCLISTSAANVRPTVRRSEALNLAKGSFVSPTTIIIGVAKQ